MKNVITVFASGLIAGVILFAGASVFAQNSGSLAAPSVGSSTSQSYQWSESKATALSALGTVIPTGLGLILASAQSGGGDQYGYHDGESQAAPALLIFSGIYVGPSLGYFYAGRPGRAFAGIGFRTAIGFGALIGAFATCGWNCGEGDGAYNAAWGIMIIGGALVAGSAIHDISKVDNAVRAQNLKYAGPKLSVLPDYSPGQKAFGLRAKLTF